MELKISQNFLHSKSLVDDLLSKSSIDKNDIVVEIGPGKGIITSSLIKHCKSVIAVETDKNFIAELKDKFKLTPNIKIYHQDFLSFQLPEGIYKTFSNIPFNITANIMRKLFNSTNPPIDSYLIMQREAALKYQGIPRETLYSILHKPWFSFEIIYSFRRTDFRPTPAVEIVMARIKKLESPLIENYRALLFKDFVAYCFTSARSNLKKGLKNIFGHIQFLRLATDCGFSISARPSEISFEQWLSIFKYFSSNIDHNRQKKVIGSYNKLLLQQGKLQKINRTRTAKKWYFNKTKKGTL